LPTPPGRLGHASFAHDGVGGVPLVAQDHDVGASDLLREPVAVGNRSLKPASVRGQQGE
jgi:hypothetical protein